MNPTTDISQEKYESLKAKYDHYHAEWKRLLGNRNYATPEDQKLLPESPTSDEISMIEVYEFRHAIPDFPERYFAYVDVKNYAVTTWTGEVLGEIIEYGRHYRSNMGDERRNIRVQMINGRTYSGTYFCSSGDYCHLKVCKN